MLWRIALIILGFILFSFGQWMAFDVYSFNKLRKVNENVSAFIHGLYNGENSIKIPNPSENIFVITTRDGKIITSNNALTRSPSTENLSYATYSKGEVQVSVYTKRMSVEEYLNTLIENPFTFGVSLAGLVFLIVGLVLVFLKDRTQTEALKEDKVITTNEAVKRIPSYDEKLIIKSLKALRTTLAMSSVIPKESLEESKRLIEDIIKKMEGRK